MRTSFSSLQQEIIEFPPRGFLVVKGPAGTGKTTASVERLVRLCGSIDDPDSILILTPQRSLAKPYWKAINTSKFPYAAPHSMMTLGGLAQRSISLFWPLISSEAGFANAKKLPVFLSLELTQFYLSRIVDPLIQKGYFNTISIDRLRLFSQIIDNLNKSAVVGFNLSEISLRLSNAWAGKSDHTSIFDQVQECSLLFREYCYQHNLLDFSLQISIFKNYLWKSFLFRQYLNNKYKHLIYDNVEEDYPIAHDIVAEWLPDLESTMVIMDEMGGFRTFLGADSISANRFIHLAEKIITLETRFNIPPVITDFSSAMNQAIVDHSIKKSVTGIEKAFEVKSYRFVPETIDAVVSQVQKLVFDEGIPPEEIAILTPFLSDAMLFSVLEKMKEKKVPISALRPSRGLKDEPSVKAILTLAKFAFPDLELTPQKEDVRNTFFTVIKGCDFIRADLLTQMVYSISEGKPVLRPYDAEKNSIRQRISQNVGLRYEQLRVWLSEISKTPEIEFDVFIGRLFGEVLSQPEFKLHDDYYQSAIISKLVRSSRSFRQTISSDESIAVGNIARTYIELVESGLLSSQYFDSTESSVAENAVLVSPAYSFLMQNKPVSYQFWLEIGSTGWWARLDQPLTQPYVLNRNWKEGSRWTDVDEFTTNQNNLARLVTGLLARCKCKVILISVDINQQGDEQRGPLMSALQTLLKKIHRESAAIDV